MAFNAIDRLREGNPDFLSSLPDGDIEHIIKDVRLLPDKVEVMKAFIPKLIKHSKLFCFNIIYDVEEFKEDARKILSEYITYITFDAEKMKNILYKTSWGENFVYYNLDKVLSTYELNKIDVLVQYIFDVSQNKNKWINKFTKNYNMHKRYLFLITLIKLYPREANEILKSFSSIVEYRIEKDGQLKLFPERVDSKELSKIVYEALHSNIDKNILETMKNYLVEKYNYNDLAELLLDTREKEKKAINEKLFKSNADAFFKTSDKYKFQILKHYKSYISNEMIALYKNLNLFADASNKRGVYCEGDVARIYYYELGRKLEHILDKYLSLSSTEGIEHIGNGTKSECFRVGDYVLKVGDGKHSREEVICPSLYLILKNLEEYYIRGNDNSVICNMEVQKYLKRSGEGLPLNIYNRFINDLRAFKYCTYDSVTLGKSGKNFRILDDYHDADCLDPEILPDYFKELPLVLCDRDLIYDCSDQIESERNLALHKNIFMY